MTRLFIGGLNDKTSRSELEAEFESFGRIDDIFVARNPPGFGFIVYEKSHDAEAAIKEMDGQMIFGEKIRVEHARERGGGRGGGFRGDMSNVKCYNCSGFGHISKDCDSRSRSYGFGGGGGGRGARGRRPSRSRSRSHERGQRRQKKRRSPSGSRSPSREKVRSRSHERGQRRQKRRTSPSCSRSPSREKHRQSTNHK